MRSMYSTYLLKKFIAVYCVQEIHKQISLLNFHDCHAKIRQVDSQATVGDGVVIQV